MTENILEIDNLSKDYGDFVLDRVSFLLPRGVIMGLIGENGAGKSTTINCILNEIQKNSGKVLIFHIISDLEKVADYITFLHKGKVIFSHEKDDLVDNYGIVSCGAAIFDTLDKTEIIAYRKEDYQYKVLVKNRNKAAKNYPKAIVTPATIEEIMLFYVKGEIQ